MRHLHKFWFEFDSSTGAAREVMLNVATVEAEIAKEDPTISCTKRSKEADDGSGGQL